MAVDWEEQVRFDRLREERLARISRLLAGSSLGALLCFDMTNIRYITLFLGSLDGLDRIAPRLETPLIRRRPRRG